MRYLRTFETYRSPEEESLDDISNEDDNVYWIVRVKQPYLKLSLKKIGMNDTDIIYWCNFFHDEDNEDYKIILFRKYNYEDECYEWSWNPISDFNYFNSPHHDSKFMCEVIIEEWEVSAEKYNIA